MKVTMKMIADASQVSISTVSRALSGDRKRPVNDETVKRIMDAAVSLGYISETGEKKNHSVLPDAPKSLVCFLASYFDTYSDSFFVRMLSGINEEASRLGYRVTHNLSVSQTNMQHIKEQIEHTECDGIILLGRYDTPTLDFIRKKTDMMVYAGLNRLNIGIDEVICDAYAAISTLVRHLIDQGNKHIGYVGAIPALRTKDIVNDHRYQAFSDTLTLAGLPIDPNICIDIDPGMNTGYFAALQLAACKSKPDAICCANDTIAIGVLSGLRDQGISVPQDIAVVGMGMDNSEISQYITPKLTTTDMHIDEIGRFAVKLLDDRINGLHTIPVVTSLPFRFIARDSSLRDQSGSERP